MKNNNGWINALFSLVFIATPSLFLFFFFLPSWNGYERVSYGMIWVIALGFISYVLLFSFLVIHYEILTIDSLSFNIPITMVLMSILISYPLPLWATAVFVILMVLFAFPVNVFVNNFKERRKHKTKNKK